MKTAIHLLLTIVLFTAFSCSSSRQQPPHFSRSDVPFGNFETLFTGVPYYEGKNVNAFMVDIQDVKIPEKMQTEGVIGTVLCHVLISKSGEPEAAYIKRGIKPGIDEAVLNAVVKSEFRPYEAVTGKEGKYSLIIPFRFYQMSTRQLDTVLHLDEFWDSFKTQPKDTNSEKGNKEEQ
ncbi:MAG: energy transducer TonB [Calditrichia bacterium]